MPTPEQVATYYNEWNNQYLSVYGDIIQAFRPSDTNKLLEYTMRSMRLEKGMRLIDAGCGFAGPSRFFASHLDVQIDAVTVSPTQEEEAGKKVKDEGLQHCVRIRQGDYHKLTSYYKMDTYDGVFFLESLGHHQNLDKVISEVWGVLKFGGFIYIKDFFYKETNDAMFNERVKRVVQKVNEDYCYNVLSLTHLLKVLRSYGFVIDFVKAPEFADDIAIRKRFEDSNNIDTFNGEEGFYYAEWLEIRCIKFKS